MPEAPSQQNGQPSASSEDSPFALPPVMDGYPLTKDERSSTEELLRRYELEQHSDPKHTADTAPTPSTSAA